MKALCRPPLQLVGESASISDEAEPIPWDMNKIEKEHFHNIMSYYVKIPQLSTDELKFETKLNYLSKYS